MRISVVLEALTADFSSDIQRSTKAAEKRIREFEKAAGSALKTAGAAAAAAGAALVLFVNRQAESIANFQDIAEKIGDTAEAVASLKTASDVSGVAFDTLAAASIKLTAALSKTDDESKGVGAALKALGLEMDAFKRLSPVEQLDAVAQAMAKFEDGASKTAVAVALFGKSGAELIPFLNDLADGSERQITLTQEQIEAADRYTKQTARLASEIGTLAQQYASELIPVFSDVLKVARDLAGEFTDLGKAQGDLALRGVIRDWAQDAVIALATVAEAVLAVIKTFRAIGGSLEVAIADLRLFASAAQLAFDATTNGVEFGLNFRARMDEFGAELAERNKVVAEANQRYIDLWNYNGTQLSDALRKQFDSTKGYVDQTAGLVDEAIGLNRQLASAPFLRPTLDPDNPQIPFRPGVDAGTPRPKPRLNYDPVAAGDADKVAKEAARKAEAMLKAVTDAQRTVFEAESARSVARLDAQLEQNLISYERYYTDRLSLEQEAIDREIEIRQRLSVSADPAEKVRLAAEIEALGTKRIAIAEESARQLADSERDLADEVASIQRDLLVETGKTYEARLADIEKELQDTIARLRANGQESGIKIAVQLAEVKGARALADDIDSRIGALQATHQRRLEQIDLSVQTRSLTRAQAKREEIAATEQLINKEKFLIDELERQNLVIGDKKLAQNIADFRQELLIVGQVGNEAFNEITGAIEDNLSTAIFDLISGTKSIEDAFSEMLLNIERDIQRFIAKQLSEQLIQSIFGGGQAGAASGGGASIWEQALNFGLSYLMSGGGGSTIGTGTHTIINPGAATGGYITGPGGPTDDLVPMRLSNGEYVIRANAVAEHGRKALDQINAGRIPDEWKRSVKDMPLADMAKASAKSAASAAGRYDVSLIADKYGDKIAGQVQSIMSPAGRERAQALAEKRGVPVSVAHQAIGLLEEVGGFAGAFLAIKLMEDYQERVTSIADSVGDATRSAHNVLSGPRESGGGILDVFARGVSGAAADASDGSRGIVGAFSRGVSGSAADSKPGGGILDVFARTAPGPATSPEPRGGIFDLFRKKADGGIVLGPGGPTEDLVPMRLSNGEYVIKAEAVAKLGRRALDQINDGEMPMEWMDGRATGGPVDDSMPYGPMFIPDMAGGVQGGQVNVNQTFHISTPTGTLPRSTQQEIASSALTGAGRAMRRNR